MNGFVVVLTQLFMYAFIYFLSWSFWEQYLLNLLKTKIFIHSCISARFSKYLISSMCCFFYFLFQVDVNMATHMTPPPLGPTRIETPPPLPEVVPELMTEGTCRSVITWFLWKGRKPKRVNENLLSTTFHSFSQEKRHYRWKIQPSKKKKRHIVTFTPPSGRSNVFVGGVGQD